MTATDVLATPRAAPPPVPGPRVIKIGGRAQADPALAAAVATGWAHANGGLVIVHGGGDEVSTLQAALGGTARFVDGRRVTTRQDVDLVRMALSGSANKRLVAALVRRGVDAVGVSGEDAALIDASPLDADRLGHVGSPSRINVAFLRHLLAGGYLPVISPVSRDARGVLGDALNVNGDDAAAAIAVALGAAELVFVADVPGVLSGGAVIPELTGPRALQLMADGTVAGGMHAKLHAGLAALSGGVPAVRVADVAGIADTSSGTILRGSGEPS